MSYLGNYTEYDVDVNGYAMFASAAESGRFVAVRGQLSQMDTARYWFIDLKGDIDPYAAPDDTAAERQPVDGLYGTHIFDAFARHAICPIPQFTAPPKPQLRSCTNMQYASQNCKDDNKFSQCESWAAQGECSMNPTYMLDCCKSSCDVCPEGNKLIRLAHVSRHHDFETMNVKNLCLAVANR